ncbi:MAG TPA: ABC transporter substrate-binding protein [Geminicoccaceae bacterium]|nr:ABC transporter substrate-binding protein [Geminicoccaceae bacterium]
MHRLTRGLLAVAFLTAGIAQAASAQDLVIWWNKSYYPEEDQQFDKLVADFRQQTGKNVELVYYANEDVPRKVLAALTAGQPPDLSYGFLFDLQHTSRWAYDGVLEDVSDVVGEIEEHLLPTAIQAVTLENGQTGDTSVYAIPVAQQIEHIHVWKSLVEQAGLSLDDVPTTWNEWWDWWCSEAQPAVRRATGDRQKYGVGQPMSSSASDTIFAYMMFLNAFDAKLVDEQGNLQVDDPGTREGMIEALESYTKPFLDGCVPPGSVNWQDSDNNVNFKNQITIMVPNPSLSIPASEYANQDRYFKEMVTMEWPDKPDGRPIEYVASIKTAVIFKDAPHKEAAKEFMRYFLQPDHLGPYLENSLARWFPVDQRLIDRPYWHDQSDPHRVVEVRQYTQRPQSVWPHYLNHKLIDVNAENAYGKAVGRMVLEDWSAEDAVDELIARIKQVAGSS